MLLNHDLVRLAGFTERLFQETTGDASRVKIYNACVYQPTSPPIPEVLVGRLFFCYTSSALNDALREIGQVPWR